MKKLLSALIISASLLSSAAFAAGVGVEYNPESKYVTVSGNVGPANAGKEVTCFIVKKSADYNNIQASDIANLSQAKVTSNGSYNFTLGFSENADDYIIKVNQAGKDISSTVTNSGIVEKNDYYSYDDFEDCQEGDVTAENQEGWIIQDNCDGRDYVDYKADINDNNISASINSWYFVKGGSDTVAIESVEGYDNLTTNALKITFDSTANSGVVDDANAPLEDNAYRTLDFMKRFDYTPAANDKIKMSYRFKINNPQPADKCLGSWYWGNAYYGNSNNSSVKTDGISMCYDFLQRNIRALYPLSDTSNEVISMMTISDDAFDSGNWHEMEYYVDFENKTMEYCIDNKMRIQRTFTDNLDMAKLLAWKINKGNADVPCTLYIDDVKLAKMNDFTLDKYSVTDAINLQFSCPVTLAQAIYGINVTENGKLLKASDLNVSTLDENTVKIVPVNGIKNHAEYKISLKDDMIEGKNFRTIIKKYDMTVYSDYTKPYVDEESFTKNVADGVTDISFNVNNPTAESKNLWCIAVTTDENNQIISMGTQKLNSVSDTAHCNLSLNGNGNAVKIYLINTTTMELYDTLTK